MTQEQDNGSNPPPNIDGKKLDFSQFHATGDHWPFTKYCRSQYGGGRVHLKYAWEFRYGPELRARTTCRVGLFHHWGGVWRGGPGPVGATYLGERCIFCHKKKPEEQRE